MITNGPKHKSKRERICKHYKDTWRRYGLGFKNIITK